MPKNALLMAESADRLFFNYGKSYDSWDFGTILVTFVAVAFSNCI